MMKTDKKIDTVFYVAGCCLIVIIAIYYIVSTHYGRGFLHFSYPCILYKVTGYYCPGCGGTRAFFYLTHGKIAASFQAHPIVPYTAILGGWFMMSQTLQRISRNKLCIGMHFRVIYLWIALAIIILNCLVKNLALYFWQIDLLA